MIIQAYKTSDGSLFEDDQDARDHQENILGEALDTLMPDALGNTTRTDRYKILMALLGDAELRAKISNLHDILEHMACKIDEE